MDEGNGEGRPSAGEVKPRGRPRWCERVVTEAEEQRRLLRMAENWEAAEAYLFETRQMKEFLMWDFRRKGTSDWLLLKLDAALDLIVYPAAGGRNPLP